MNEEYITLELTPEDEEETVITQDEESGDIHIDADETDEQEPVIELEAEENESVDIEIAEEADSEIELSMEDEGVGEYPVYAGEYEITPSLETQTLETAYRVLTSNVVIAPIPSNYGKISYDGSTLTIT